jgi:hypothetical protein
MQKQQSSCSQLLLLQQQQQQHPDASASAEQIARPNTPTDGAAAAAAVAAATAGRVREARRAARTIATQTVFSPVSTSSADPFATPPPSLSPLIDVGGGGLFPTSFNSPTASTKR